MVVEEEEEEDEEGNWGLLSCGVVDRGIYWLGAGRGG